MNDKDIINTIYFPTSQETIKPVKVSCKIITSGDEQVEKEFYVLSNKPLSSAYTELTKIFTKEKITSLCLHIL